MGSYYSGDHIAGDHINADITACNTDEPQQKYRLGTDSNRLLGSRICLTGPRPRPLLQQWFKPFGPHEGFLIH